MKRAKIQMLALAILLYSGAALAQHGHGAGGMGAGGAMGHGNSMGHDMSASNHGHGDGKGSGIHGTTMSGPLKINPTIRSEEHTSELQSLTNLVCRLLLEK